MPNKTTSLSELETYLVIDRLALDKHVEEQIQLTYTVDLNIAKHTKILTLKKGEYEQYIALLYTLEKEQSPKATDAVIQRIIKMDKTRVQVANEIAELEYELEKWKSMRNAVIQRGYSIKNLIELYVSGYWTASHAVKGK